MDDKESVENIEQYLDDVFGTLRVRERRHILRHLQDTSDTSSLHDIASYLEERSDMTEEQLKVSLSHNHLPRMDEQGWIDYDHRSKQVQDATVNQDTKDRMLIDYAADTVDQDDSYMDAVFDALTDEYSRKTLYMLMSAEDGRSTLRGITEQLADHTEDDVETVQIRLHHSTLPRLEDAGWISYEPETRKVRMTADADTLPQSYLKEMYAVDE